MASERRIGVDLEMGVDPHAAGLELSCYSAGFFQVVGPDRGAETHLGVVGTSNDIVLVFPCQERHNRSEGLFGDNARVVGRLVNDGGCDLGRVNPHSSFESVVPE